MGLIPPYITQLSHSSNIDLCSTLLTSSHLSVCVMAESPSPRPEVLLKSLGKAAPWLFVTGTMLVAMARVPNVHSCAPFWADFCRFCPVKMLAMFSFSNFPQRLFRPCSYKSLPVRSHPLFFSPC